MAKKTPTDSTDPMVDAPAPVDTLTGTGPQPEDVEVTPKKVSRKRTKKAKTPIQPELGPDEIDLFDRIEAWCAAAFVQRQGNMANAAVIIAVLALIIGAHWATQNVDSNVSGDAVAQAETQDAEAPETAADTSGAVTDVADAGDSTQDQTAPAAAVDTPAVEKEATVATKVSTATITESEPVSAKVDAVVTEPATSATVVAPVASATLPKTTVAPSLSTSPAPTAVAASGSVDRVGVSLLAALDPTVAPIAPKARAHKAKRKSSARTARRSPRQSATKIATTRTSKGLHTLKLNAGGFEDLDSAKARKRYQKLNLEAARSK